jgi:predicted site-specific integrase-resolvase
MMTEKLVSRQELAEQFKVTVPTIRRSQKQGKLVPVRLSAGVVRYRLSQVEQFLAEAGKG